MLTRESVAIIKFKIKLIVIMGWIGIGELLIQSFIYHHPISTSILGIKNETIPKLGEMNSPLLRKLE